MFLLAWRRVARLTVQLDRLQHAIANHAALMAAEMLYLGGEHRADAHNAGSARPGAGAYLVEDAPQAAAGSPNSLRRAGRARRRIRESRRSRAWLFPSMPQRRVRGSIGGGVHAQLAV